MNTLDYELNEWTFFDIASLSISTFEDELQKKTIDIVSYDDKPK